MPANAREWRVTPSLYQRRLDWLAQSLLFIFIVLAVWFAPTWWQSVSVAALFGLMVVIRHLTQASFPIWIGEQDGQWWWQEQDAPRQPLNICAGSIKRPELVVIQRSIWPWQRWMLRADSFLNEQEFQRFRAALYPQL